MEGFSRAALLVSACNTGQIHQVLPMVLAAGLTTCSHGTAWEKPGVGSRACCCLPLSAGALQALCDRGRTASGRLPWAAESTRGSVPSSLLTTPSAGSPLDRVMPGCASCSSATLARWPSSSSPPLAASTSTLLPFSVHSLANRTGTHDTDWGVRGNGSMHASCAHSEKKKGSMNHTMGARGIRPPHPLLPPPPLRCGGSVHGSCMLCQALALPPPLLALLLMEWLLSTAPLPPHHQRREPHCRSGTQAGSCAGPVRPNCC